MKQRFWKTYIHRSTLTYFVREIWLNSWPPVWTQRSKYICRYFLSIVLQPLASSFYCLTLKMQLFQTEKLVPVSALFSGDEKMPDPIDTLQDWDGVSVTMPHGKHRNPWRADHVETSIGVAPRLHQSCRIHSGGRYVCQAMELHGQAENNHCIGKDHCTVGLQFNWNGFDQRRKYVLFWCSEAV